MDGNTVHHPRRGAHHPMKERLQYIWIVIAAFNEERAIAGVIRSLRKAGYARVVVVDDCSEDRTLERAERTGAIVLHHAINLGQGAALKTGIDYALANGARVIVTFDADGQHRVQDLPAMLKPVLSGQVDVTLGSRFLYKRDNVPLLRRITLKMAIFVQRVFYGIKLTDAHNGFRVFSRKAAQFIDITCDRMAHASEITEQIKLKKLRYKEIPVIIHYSDETLRKGHGGVRQALKVFKDMLLKKLVN
ncbi:MAG: glycosyltransferase family 2 protein [archaeon]